MTTTAPIIIEKSHILFSVLKWLAKPALEKSARFYSMIQFEVSETSISAITIHGCRLHRAIFSEAAANILKPLLEESVSSETPYSPQPVQHLGVFNLSVSTSQITLEPLLNQRFPNYKPITNRNFTEAFHTQLGKELITGSICAKLGTPVNSTYILEALGYGAFTPPSKYASAEVAYNLNTDGKVTDIIKITPEMRSPTAQLSAFIMPARNFR